MISQTNLIGKAARLQRLALIKQRYQEVILKPRGAVTNDDADGFCSEDDDDFEFAD
jgi:hypothetical protein